MLYLSIILQSWLVWCVTGRPLPCTMVDDKQGKGAMLCCDYQPLPHEEGLTGIEVQSNQVLYSDKKCTLMTPKTSLGLVKEVWSLRNYTWAAGMLKTKLPNTKDIPRHKGCCFEDQFFFSISNEGISAETGKTHKIVQQGQYVQPILSLLCVRNDNCHNSGNMKVFQRMEAHSHYVESEDHPEYAYEELLLKPSGCLCAPDTQTVKADIGEILIPMNLIEEAMTDSRIVKRNVEYHTALPDILRLALEIMREPNPLPVLDSIERQMALQLQQTRYFAAIAMASGLGGGGFGPNYRNNYQQNQQGNETKADVESLKKFPLHSYQLILSAFVSGLALGQNFQNISQVEILDRLIVDNGNSGINLLETILKLQNHSLALDYNSIEVDYNPSINITIIDNNGTYSNKSKLIDNTTKVVDSGLSSPTYVTTTNDLSSPTYVTTASDLSSPTYVTKTSDLSNTTYVIDSGSSSQAYVNTSSGLSSTTHTSFSVFSNTTHVTSTATAVDTTEKTIIHTSSKDSVTAYSTASAMVYTSTETSIDISSEGVDVIPSVASADSTTDAIDISSEGVDVIPSVASADSTTDAASIVQTSSQKVDFVSNDSIIDSTSDSSLYSSSYEEFTTADSIAGISTIFNEGMTPKAAALVDRTDSTADTSSGKEYTTPVADSHVYFDEQVSTNAPAVFDDATEHGSSNEDYSTHAGAPMIGNGVTNADTMVGSTAEPYIQTSYNQDYSTNAAEFFGNTTEPAKILYSEDTSTASAMDDSTTESAVHTSYNDADTTVEIKEPGVTTSNDEYVTTSYISTESEIPESKFDLHEYIMELPQFQPLTIDTELLMHIMFPPEPITHDERESF